MAELQSSQSWLVLGAGPRLGEKGQEGRITEAVPQCPPLAGAQASQGPVVMPEVSQP